MAKIFSVWLNDYEQQLLGDLVKILNVEHEGTALKMALKHLANDHQHGEPAQGRIEDGLRVEVPALVHLRAMVKECLKEVKEEPEKQKREFEDAWRANLWKSLKGEQ